MTLEWDAVEYEALSGPQVSWGTDLLGRALGRRPLGGDEAAVDAGCGTGRVTELLLERLPRGTVLAVDASEAMVEAAGRRFAGDARVRVERVDLLRLEVEEPVDLILSTATFHWIKDHEGLFRRLARVLKPGGRLIAQCGGTGNVARVQAAAERVMEEYRYRRYFANWEDPWNFAGPATTSKRLEGTGFEGVETWLHEEDTEFGAPDELARYLKTVVLSRHLALLPEAEKDPFAAAVVARLAAEGSPSVDYVRLNMLATRSGQTASSDNEQAVRGDEEEVLRGNKAEERA